MFILFTLLASTTAAEPLSPQTPEECANQVLLRRCMYTGRAKQLEGLHQQTVGAHGYIEHYQSLSDADQQKHFAWFRGVVQSLMQSLDDLRPHAELEETASLTPDTQAIAAELAKPSGAFSTTVVASELARIASDLEAAAKKARARATTEDDLLRPDNPELVTREITIDLCEAERRKGEAFKHARHTP